MRPLNISTLDFEGMKANLIEFLKNDNKYSDWNFSGSSINALLNILVYIAHQLGYYIKALLNESFIDSATQYSSLLSKAKLTAYVPKGMRAARAIVELKIQLDPIEDVESKSIIIPRGSFFSGNNATNDSRNFYVLDDVLSYNRTVNALTNKITYTSPQFLVYEGKLKVWRFIKENIAYQRFIIKDNTIDADTIRVNTYQDAHPDTRTEFKLATSVFEVDALSKVFYLSTNSDGFTELFFGNNQFGVEIENNTVIEVTYISSTGEYGNGCTKMVYQRPNVEIVTRQTTGSFSSFTTTIMETSSGGMLPESIDDLRFNIPHHYKRQNRIVTEQDYKTILLEKFRDIDSINVWGGEKNYNREYGSVFISIKPKYNTRLSSTAKKEIELIVGEYNVSGLPIILKDPEYLFIDMNVFVKYDRNLTNKSSGEISSLVYNRIVEYNNLYMDKFNIGLSDVDLLDYARIIEPSITRIYDTKTLRKQHIFQYRDTLENIIQFGNPINKGSLITSGFKYGALKCKLIDDSKGNIIIVDYLTDIPVLNTPLGKIDYTTGNILIVLKLDIVSDTDYGNSGLISFNATPSLPDIDTYQQGIISLENIRVII